MNRFDAYQSWASYNASIEPDNRLADPEDWLLLTGRLVEAVHNDIGDIPPTMDVGFLPFGLAPGADCEPERKGHAVATTPGGRPPTVVLRRGVSLLSLLPVIADSPSQLSGVVALLDRVPVDPVARLAYLIEYSDDGQTWWKEDGGDGGGMVTSAEEPDELAVCALAERLGRLLDEDRDFEDLWYRCTVWDVDRVQHDGPSLPEPTQASDPASYAWRLQRLRVTPLAVEVRTPLQVHRQAWRARTSSPSGRSGPTF